ncbi:MAG: chemotaxis protein CheW, partial [Myxococcales bacterium]|nr:chemotaxis protein CheW [Myxococcales bacterium]
RGAEAPVGVMQHRREVVAFYALDVLLGLRRDRAGGAATAGGRRALVVRCAGEAIGFLLDAVHGQQEAVVRPLVDPLVRVPGLSAATDLGDGRPTLVLDLAALAARAHPRGQALPAPGTPPLLPRRPSVHGSLP